MSRSTTRPAGPKRRYKVGSQAFFEGMPGFMPGDIDELEFEEQPKLFRDFMQIRKKDRTRCLFIWRKMDPDEFIDYALRSRTPMEAGKFLVPEVAEDLGITIEHLKRLEPVFDRLDERHAYERIIFDAYMQNGEIRLTEEQRDLAYEVYKSKRYH